MISALACSIIENTTSSTFMMILKGTGSAMSSSSETMPQPDKVVTFSFLLPTRNRPQQVNTLFQSIVDTTHNLNEIEVVLGVDDDDLASQNITHDKLAVKTVVIPKRSTMGKLNRACFEASSGRYVMLINDDVILR